MGKANISKKTAILLGAIAGIVVILIGTIVWGISTGTIKIGAYQYWFPRDSENQGLISGTVTSQSPCSIYGAEVRLMHFKPSGGIDWTRRVDVSSDGSYSFHRVPFSSGEYQVGVGKHCPPSSGMMGYCDGLSMRAPFIIDQDNPEEKDVNIVLKPFSGRLVIQTRKIVKPPTGPGPKRKPSNCTITSSGNWDCPVSYADLTVDGFSAKTNSNGIYQTIKSDYRLGGSVDIKATKGSLSGSKSTNVIGCQRNPKKGVIKIYLK